MKKTLHLTAFLVPAALLGLVQDSSAQSFNLDLGDPMSAAGIPASTYGAASGQVGVWNAYGVATVYSGPIVDLAGMATSVAVGISVTSPGTPNDIYSNNVNTLGDDQALLDDLADPSGGDTFIFTGLANGAYQIWTYAWAADTRTAVTNVTPTGQMPVAVGGADWTGSFIQGENYAVHCVNITNNQIEIVFDTITSFSSVNGIQFVQTAMPCPSPPGDFVESCFGDGGDQAGCTNCPCGNNAAIGTIGGCLNSNTRSGRLLPSGVPSVSSDTLRMEMSGGTSNSFGILLSGPAIAPTNASNPCFGLNSGIQAPVLDGLRCAVAGVQRHGTRPVDVNGDIGVTTNGWGPPNGPMGGLAAASGFNAGDTSHFQVFYRDMPTAGCGTGQNTTQAVTVVWVP